MNFKSGDKVLIIDNSYRVTRGAATVAYVDTRDDTIHVTDRMGILCWVNFEDIVHDNDAGRMIYMLDERSSNACE